jgi:hypothetical protein
MPRGVGLATPAVPRSRTSVRAADRSGLTSYTLAIPSAADAML